MTGIGVMTAIIFFTFYVIATIEETMNTQSQRLKQIEVYFSLLSILISLLIVLGSFPGSTLIWSLLFSSLFSYSLLRMTQ